jgi:hypothetical protein
VTAHTVNTQNYKMRTKALLSVAAIAASAISGMAQSSVYSLNIVGYATVTINAGYNLLANPLSAGATNGANEIMPIIDGEVILTWNGKGYDYAGFDSGFNGWVDANNNPSQPPSLPPGKGFFFLNPLAATNVTFVGQVVPGPTSTNTLQVPAGYSLLGSPLPASVAAITNAPVSLPVADGNVILTWGGKSYVYSGLDSAFNGWVDANNNPSTAPALAIGQGFFYLNSGTPFSWSQSLP